MGERAPCTAARACDGHWLRPNTSLPVARRCASRQVCERVPCTATGACDGHRPQHNAVLPVAPRCASRQEGQRAVHCYKSVQRTLAAPGCMAADRDVSRVQADG